jgi:hypothetical protein
MVRHATTVQGRVKTAQLELSFAETVSGSLDGYP